MITLPPSLRRTARSLGLLSVVVLSTLGALSLAHVGPAQAQSPGVNLAQLVATVNALKSQQASDEQTITSQGNTIKNLQSSLSDVQSKQKTDEGNIGKLQMLTAPLSLSNDPSAGGTNTLLTITGVNVQIVNGQGGTETANGLGNLIVGYDEKDGRFTQTRAGSHNLVVGMGNNYLSYGGLVAGQSNLISAPYASVTGGQDNVANSGHASVSGGSGNVASGGSSSVSGGSGNVASADYASVSGGYQNTAEGNEYTSISGGYQNVAFGEWASVSGGYQNIASGEKASVSGGYQNTAKGIEATVTGGEFNKAGGIATSISGGASRNQSTNDGWTAGSDSPNSSDYIGDFRSP